MIIAIVLVVFVGIIFVVMRGVPKISLEDNFNPESFIDSCVRQSVSDKLDVMLPQGGFYDPKNYKLYNDVKISYLCKNINNYEPCINQHPVLRSEIREDLKAQIEDDVSNCFSSLEDEMKKRNYDVSSGNPEINIELKPGRVAIIINDKFSFSKGNTDESFSSFESEVMNPIYDLSGVAQEIVKQEAKYCHFSVEGYSLIHSKFVVKRDTLSDSTKIYNILDVKSGKEMNIAIRGCVLP